MLKCKLSFLLFIICLLMQACGEEKQEEPNGPVDSFDLYGLKGRVRSVDTYLSEYNYYEIIDTNDIEWRSAVYFFDNGRIDRTEERYDTVYYYYDADKLVFKECNESLIAYYYVDSSLISAPYCNFLDSVARDGSSTLVGQSVNKARLDLEVEFREGSIESISKYKYYIDGMDQLKYFNQEDPLKYEFSNRIQKSGNDVINTIKVTRFGGILCSPYSSYVVNHYQNGRLLQQELSRDADEFYPERKNNTLNVKFSEDGRMHSFGDTIYTYFDDGKLEIKTFGDHFVRYNEMGNLTNEHQIRGGYGFSSDFMYSYRYDKYGNWTTKYTFTDAMKLLKVEKRNIEYFIDGEQKSPRQADTKKIHSVHTMALNFLNDCESKQAKKFTYLEQRSKGAYDKWFTKTSAATIEEFTPRLWNKINEYSFDYNNDGQMDYIVIYDTPLIGCKDPGYTSLLRVIAMFRQEEGAWTLKDSFTDMVASRTSDDQFEGIDFDDQYLISVSKPDSEGTPDAINKYYQYLGPNADFSQLKGEGWYLVKVVEERHEGSMNMYFTKDFIEGYSQSSIDYQYEDPEDSPIGRNGLVEKAKTEISQKPTRIYGKGVDPTKL